MKAFATVALLALLALAPAPGPASAATAAPAAAAPAALATYMIGVADKLRITVYNEPTLSGDFLVNADGSLALPLLGNMVAAGLSAPTLQTALEAKYAEGYLRNPRVGVQVLTYRPFYIYGQVVKPGEYAYSEDLSVMKAVALAEGFTSRANRGKIFIKPAIGKELQAPLDKIVQPGDLIRITERNF